MTAYNIHPIIILVMSSVANHFLACKPSTTCRTVQLRAAVFKTHPEDDWRAGASQPNRVDTNGAIFPFYWPA